VRISLRRLLVVLPLSTALAATGTVAYASPSSVATLDPGRPLGTWQTLSAKPLPFYPQAAMVLTDGSVMLQQVTSDTWWRLRPDASGSYTNGTYEQTPPMPGGYAPTYECRTILPDGRMLILGGEYQGESTPAEQATGAIYDPVANSWQSVPPPPNTTNLGDIACSLMPNGKVLIANQFAGRVNGRVTLDLLDPATMTWQVLNPVKADGLSEEGWTLLPDGTILTVDVAAGSGAERYIPPWLDGSADGQWISAGNPPDTLTKYFEIGPGVLRPDGTVFVAGANGHNAVYTPPKTLYGTGTWTAAGDFTAPSGELYGETDGTASLLPDGTVMTIAGQSLYSPPSMEFAVNGTRTAPMNPQLPDSVNSQIKSYSPDSVILPTGQVLATLIGGGDEPLIPPYVFTPFGAANPDWAPTISTHDQGRVPVTAGSTITLKGTQLSGLSQGSNYGDDGDSVTNFPLVRIVDQAGRVWYARTFGWSNAVAQGATPMTTKAALPRDLPKGPAKLYVVANGIASAPLKIQVN
jgi:hypothetical protein